MISTVALDPGRAQRRSTAMVLTIALHAGLLLLLFFLKIVTPIPPFPEGGGEGMELGIADLGFSDEGKGDNESMEESAPAPAQSAAQPAESNEELISEDDGEVINRPPDKTEKPRTEKPVTTTTKKPPRISEPTVNPNALFNTSNNPSNGSDNDGKGGDGDSKTPGNEGIPNGDPSGHGRGGWGDWKLSGRGLGRGPVINEKPNEAGKVVLNIYVDPAGKVTRVAWNSGKSTTTNQRLVDLAKKAALQCTFTAKPGAAAEQVGEMTFVFILE
jgi:outer membrane biosynthesis protein TonB